MRFHALREALPGPVWQAHFERYWAAYRRWYLSEGDAARPSYLESNRELARRMPEIHPLYRELTELAGGGDLAARFLSSYSPPPFPGGCSQVAWSDRGRHLLVRNYDYHPALLEGTLLATAWDGRRIIGMSDCLWGLLDGMNDAGLVASLAFGGRRSVGPGFGIPVMLRYVLQTCETVGQACDALSRVRPHMSYNVTLLDRDGDCRTVRIAPDRDPVVLPVPYATNHQGRVEWRAHATATATLERERFLAERITEPALTRAGLVGAFLRPPLYSTAFARGFGTLYTAAYDPVRGVMELRWPDDAPWIQSFDHFTEGERRVTFRHGRPARVGARLRTG